jgi:general stress protein 26
MANSDNLSGNTAIQKIKEIVKHAGTCMFVTNVSKFPLSARPMATIEVEDNGSIWFFSKDNSEKNQHISVDSKVQLFYENHSSSEYISVSGNAQIVRDKKKIEELWTPMARNWFKGPEDPSCTLIKFIPDTGHYWDTKNNKMVQMIKMAVGMVTGQTMDDGRDGSLIV